MTRLGLRLFYRFRWPAPLPSWPAVPGAGWSDPLASRAPRRWRRSPRSRGSRSSATPRATTGSTRIRSSGARQPAVDVLDRRRHRFVRERAPVPRRRGSCRRPDAVRIEELVNYFHYVRPGAAGRRAAGRAHRGRALPLGAGTPARAHRAAGARSADAASRRRAEPRLPDRRLGLDGRAEQAAARHHARSRLLVEQLGERDRIAHGRLRRRGGAGAAADAGERAAAAIRRRSRASKPAARPTAAPGSSSPTRSRSEASSRAASTA